METPSLIRSSIPKAREGAGLWLFKIFAGLMIVILLAVHFIVNHLAAPTGLLSYADVVRYYQNPFIPVMEITFLGFVISHALVGLRSIFLDLNPTDRVLKWVDTALLLLGCGAFVYGVWLVLDIASKGVN